MKKRILACIVCLCVVLSIAPTIVFAEDKEERVTSINDNGFRVWSDDDKEFINRTSFREGNVVVIDQAGNYNVEGSTTRYRIGIRITDETKAGDVKIALNGTSIKPTAPGAAIGVAEECAKETKVTIELSEGPTNVVKGCENAGINNLGRELKIVGKGTLDATGDNYAAGIGGGDKGNGSNITISGSAKVYATGNMWGAGIGGGYRGIGSNIIISGSAKVNAEGGSSGAGIGGGYKGNGSNITISGSTKVEAKGGYDGAGIGGGYYGNGTNITISDHAMVTAIGGPRYGIGQGAGIGGGDHGNGSNITISGSAEVYAKGGYRRNTIDSTDSKRLEECRKRGTLRLWGDKDGTSELYSDCNIAAGIGGGYQGNGSNITIFGNPTIKAISEMDGAGIGNGLGATGESKITISGGTIKTSGCKPFSNTPNLSGYKSPEIWLNGEKHYYPHDDMFIKDAPEFEIKPAASVSPSTDVPSASNTSGSTDSSDLMD